MRVGKTIHIVGGLACILVLPQSISLTTKKHSAWGMVPPHCGKNCRKWAFGPPSSVLQAVLVKIVTEIEEKKCCLLESKWKIKYDLLRN